MKAIRVHQTGGPEVMQLDELPTPSAGSGEALIEVAAIGLNYIDVYFRTGLYQTRPSLFHYIMERRELLQRASDVLGWISEGELRLRVEQEFPLARAADAHRALEGRKTMGKVLLIP
jgi:NADPH:quinone reductase-like Zn-dependent oxidoreductase